VRTSTSYSRNMSPVASAPTDEPASPSPSRSGRGSDRAVPRRPPRPVGPPPPRPPKPPLRGAPPTGYKPPLRGALVLGADDEAQLARQLELVVSEARAGSAPAPAAPSEAALRADERVAIDYGDAGELAQKGGLALQALRTRADAAWKALAGRGIFRGHGAPGKVAFLYTGQGSQYANVLADLRQVEPIVSEAFDDADRIMRPLLDGRNLSD